MIVQQRRGFRAQSGVDPRGRLKRGSVSYGGGDGGGLEPPEKWAEGGSCHSSPGWFWLLQEMNFGGFDAHTSG